MQKREDNLESVRLEMGDGYHLSPIMRADKEAFVEHLADPEIARNVLAIPYPYTEANADWWIGQCERAVGSLPTTLAVREPSGRLIGEIGTVGVYDAAPQRAEFGYWLAKGCRGQGLMPRAISAFTDYGFSRLGLHRLYATPFFSNAASHRALEKAGYVREGVLRGHHWKDGACLDAVMYGRVSEVAGQVPSALKAPQTWYAVKCLFSHPTRASDADGNLYEERTTLWRATSWEESFALAEAEARQYASESQSQFFDATDAFKLFEATIGHGSEVWSVMRGSHMSPELYLETFCATPRDRATPL